MKYEIDMVVMSVGRSKDNPNVGSVHVAAPQEPSPHGAVDGPSFYFPIPKKELSGWGALIGKTAKVTVND